MQGQRRRSSRLVTAIDLLRFGLPAATEPAIDRNGRNEDDRITPMRLTAQLEPDK